MLSLPCIDRLTNTSRVSIDGNQLMITNVTLSDAGHYQCVASSDAGIAVSNKIRIYTIGQFQLIYFTYMYLYLLTDGYSFPL